jgi:hypothetical protein
MIKVIFTTSREKKKGIDMAGTTLSSLERAKEWLAKYLRLPQSSAA